MHLNRPKGILVVIELLSLTFFIDTASSRELDRKVDGIIEPFNEEAQTLQRPKYLPNSGSHEANFRIQKFICSELNSILSDCSATSCEAVLMS